MPQNKLINIKNRKNFEEVVDFHKPYINKVHEILKESDIKIF